MYKGKGSRWRVFSGQQVLSQVFWAQVYRTLTVRCIPLKLGWKQTTELLQYLICTLAAFIHHYTDCRILDQLKFPNCLHRQPLIHHITIVQTPDRVFQGMSNHSKGSVLQRVMYLLYQPRLTEHIP